MFIVQAKRNIRKSNHKMCNSTTYRNKSLGKGKVKGRNKSRTIESSEGGSYNMLRLGEGKNKQEIV